MESLLFSPGLSVHKILCVRSKSLFFPSPVEVLQSNLAGLQSQIPYGLLLPLLAFPGAQNLHNSGRTSLVLLCSSLWVAHPVGMGLDFIMLHPSYCFTEAFL